MEQKVGDFPWQPIEAHYYDKDGPVCDLPHNGARHRRLWDKLGLGGNKPLYVARPMPKDLSKQMRATYDRHVGPPHGYCHTPIWLPLDKFIKVYNKTYPKRLRRIAIPPIPSNYDPDLSWGIFDSLLEQADTDTYVYWINHAWDLLERHELNCLISGHEPSMKIRIIFWFDS